MTGSTRLARSAGKQLAAMATAVSTAVTLAKMERSHQHANCVPQVLCQVLEERKAVLGVVLLAHGLDRTKLQCGLPAGLGGRHAGTQIFLGLQGKVLGDLFTDTLVGAPSGGEVREANEKAGAGISWQVLGFDLKEARDGSRGLILIAGLRLQLFAAGRGKAIEAGAAVVFRCAPLRGNRAFMLQL